MIRPVRIGLTVLLAASLLSGAAYAATRPIPANLPQTPVQNTTATELPGDRRALQQVLQAQLPFQYKILVVDGTDGEDRTDYLDRVAEAWDQPAGDTLLLVLFRENNWDIRFYMGAAFRERGVTVDQMLGLVREAYLPRARSGDPAGGLAGYLGAVAKLMGNPAPWMPSLDFSVRDPFGSGSRMSAAGQGEIGKGLLVAYLSQFQADGVPDDIKLNQWRYDESQLNVVASTEGHPEAAQQSITFQVTYDVQPLHPGGVRWLTGNGTQGEGGWITGKTYFMKAVKDGGMWRLESFATGL